MRRSHSPPEALNAACNVPIGDPICRAAGRPVHRAYRRREAITDDSAAEGLSQIINPLWTGTATSYSLSWVRKTAVALKAISARFHPPSFQRPEDLRC
jgi:hypothetical protein